MNKSTGGSVSFCMIVKNEGLSLTRCLESIKAAADEIIIVDTGSTDKSINIAERFNARIVRYKSNGIFNFGRARNLYLQNARFPWILTLDADEVIAQKDLSKIMEFVKSRRILGYALPVRNYSRQINLVRSWYPNDGTYAQEEKLSRCPGYSLTKRVRLFRNIKEIRYYEKPFPHSDFLKIESFDPEEKLKKGVRDCDVTIHHFQYLKGGEKFIAGKEEERLKAMMRYPAAGTALNYYNIGLDLFRLGKDEDAIKYIKIALLKRIARDRAYFALGLIYAEREKHKEAAYNLKKAIDINPLYADAWMVLGMVYDKQGSMAAAERCLKKTVSLRPMHPLAHNSLGVIYHRQARPGKARAEYAKAIRNNPYFRPPYNNLAKLCRDKK